MRHTLIPYLKDKLSKSLIVVPLLFGLLTFSGIEVPSQPNQQKATQTELVNSKTGKVLKRFLSYKKIIELKNLNYSAELENRATARGAFNLLIEVKLKITSAQFHDLKPLITLIKSRTVSINSDEDFPPIQG